MYFNKLADPINCRFATAFDPDTGALTLGEERLRLEREALGDDVFRVRVQGPRWPEQHSQVELDLPDPAQPNTSRVELGRRGELAVLSATAEPLLRSVAGAGFGVCGRTWLFQFEVAQGGEFFGMGEKGVGFERSGVRTKFWNTDVWADFPMSQVESGCTDPMYANVPWLIIRQPAGVVGLWLNNPRATFARTPPGAPSGPPSGQCAADRRLWLGAEGGAVEMFVLVANSVSALVETFQRLVGVTPRPPLWALGHHQCRWGYRSQGDLEELADAFEHHGIPNDGLWLDIDYMRGFRVFTIDSEAWPDPKPAIAALRARGYRVVPILDPGVKLEPGYGVYDEGRRRKAFCLGPEGKPYAGIVWPGQTVFPDFSRLRVRGWWADRVAAFTAAGFSGYWLDMNDPATGANECVDMLFDRGHNDHASFHNQYASGMARASRGGLERAHPDQRPFLLTRSACAGTGRYAAVWTGDNCSNWYHLKKSIEVSLNLALSGIPFNGPDVPGFGLDPDARLAVAWYQVCFLFPFLRNHSHKRARRQEPWTFGASSRVIARYIRLRYKLLPYLYQLFVEQERRGTPLLRPLLFEAEGSPALKWGRVDDQFLVGPAVLQAPLVTEGPRRRRVVLPAGRWFDGRTGGWKRGDRTLSVVACKPDETPLYVREGSLLPMQPGERRTAHSDLSDIELHLFCPPGGRGRLRYTFDDGASLGYRRGQQSVVDFEARVTRATVQLRATFVEVGAGPLRVRFVVYGGAQRTLSLETAGSVRGLSLRSRHQRLTGVRLEARSTDAVQVG